MMKEILFVLLNDFADWEATPLAAAINQREGDYVKTGFAAKNKLPQ